jgi:hypothetical protein
MQAERFSNDYDLTVSGVVCLLFKRHNETFNIPKRATLISYGDAVKKAGIHSLQYLGSEVPY